MQETAHYLDVPTSTVQKWQAEGLKVPTAVPSSTDQESIARWIARKLDLLEQRFGDPQFSQKTLEYGFMAGVLFCFLAFASLVTYLYFFLLKGENGYVAPSANAAGNVTELALMASWVQVKLKLLSCGLMAGSAIAFLGLSLFLLGVRGAMNVDFGGGTYQANLVNVAPGTIVILCSVLLIAICVTREISWTRSQTPSQQQSDGKGGSAPPSVVPTAESTFKFNAPLALATKLRDTLSQGDEQGASGLSKVIYLADNSLELVREYETAMVSLGRANSDQARSLRALKVCLAEISATESEQDNAIELIKTALRKLEDALQKNSGQAKATRS